MRPDVYHFVNENIGQTPERRPTTAEEHKFEPSASGQGVEIVSNGPSTAAADAEVEDAAEPQAAAEP